VYGINILQQVRQRIDGAYSTRYQEVGVVVDMSEASRVHPRLTPSTPHPCVDSFRPGTQQTVWLVLSTLLEPHSTISSHESPSNLNRFSPRRLRQ
jgi:hypothetical protein